MPNETSKPKKGKQGIKDLGNKERCLLLTALQTGQLKIVKAESDKIKNDEIAVIATAKPTTFNSVTVHSCAVFASGRTWIGLLAPKSTTATHVKHKKSLNLTSIVEVASANKQETNPPPTANKNKSHSSDSEELPSAPNAKQAPSKKHVVTTETDLDPDNPISANDSQPSPPPPVKQASLRME
ncbi:hypothetical protein H2248_011411 [Termitomyces sp. 'cryptogamus']|nr:hypothetical protein H2248_011411 [Termitomyces sp. 'cryptogamus']